MESKDTKVQMAVAHWAHRFVSNGIPLADFNDVAAIVNKWDDWCMAWENKGKMHALLGDDAKKNNFNLSAAEHYNTAAVCYHYGKFLFVQKPDEMKRAHTMAVKYHQKSMQLSNPIGERIKINWNNLDMYGNLRKPNNIINPPVVIMCMGLDSAKEEMETNERVFLERGIATLAFDGPGQGEGEYDAPICPEYEGPVSAVIDYIEKRDDLSSKKIGVWGVSLGGYYAPRAAAFDDRIIACISLTGPFNWNNIFDRIPGLTKEAFIYRSKCNSEEEAREFASRMDLTNCARNIKCPIYIVGGGLDRVVPPEESKLLVDSVNGEVVFNMIEDGTHVANNRIYRYRTQSADWLRMKLN
ncbi:MAG: alpha/beta hydrolase [Hyphomicrobiales bacterium]|jgi:2,6-dihydroxypseudooxynicotine hydrolase|nr:alpha/beta hydrolase [Hyphomicrobiales bacterium]|tara:strand:- start:1272 stop:2336 length:1065 start_codon:yes stop_codon:yes gene_type:complete